MIEADNGVIDDGSASATTDPIEPVVTDVTEPVVPSDEDMVETYLEDGGEITYDESQQENFKVDLLTAGESGQALFRQIESDNFLNKDGSLTVETIAKAKAHGMTDSEIQGHQDSLLKQIDTQRNEMFAATGFQVGYVKTVVDWAINSFTKSELAIFEADTIKNSKGSLLALEKYYQRVVVDGGER